MPSPKLVKHDDERPMTPAEIAAANPKSAEHVALEEKLNALRRKRADSAEDFRSRRSWALTQKRAGDPKAESELLSLDREIEALDRQISQVRAQWEPHRDEHRRRVVEALDKVRVPMLRRILDALNVLTTEVPVLNEFQTEFRRIGFGDAETVYIESDASIEYVRSQVEAVLAGEESGFARNELVYAQRAPGSIRTK